MRYVVTGATGFVGGAVARTLARQGHDVTGVGRDEARGAALTRDGIIFRRLDIRGARWDNLMEGCDGVVHAAAEHTFWDHWESYRDTNVEASGAIARACRTYAVRLVHVSHSSVYNVSQRQWDIPESQPCGPRFDSRYALSKYRAEEEVLGALPSAAVVRLRRVYGPGDPSFMPRVADAVRSGRLPRLSRHGVPNEMCHIDNAVHGLVLALQSRIAGPVNIADGEQVEMWSVVDRLADRLQVPRPTAYVPASLAVGVAHALEWATRVRRSGTEPAFTASAVRMLTRGMSLDLTLAREQLGYAPVVSAAPAMAAAIAAYTPTRRAR